jgi:uncharacterized membrane protein
VPSGADPPHGRPVLTKLALAGVLFHPSVPMSGLKSRWPAAIALVGTILGLVFALNSTLDYAQHLDRRLHDVHCSFIPGAPPTSEAESCRAAMYSPYSAILKEAYWGGVPITLFALGSFAFFAGFCLYLVIAGERASRLAVGFFAAVSITPSLVSLYMFYLSVTRLGVVCQTCVGLYISSFLVSLGGLLGLLTLRQAPAPLPAGGGSPPAGRPRPSPLFAVVWLAALGLLTLLPSVVYAARVPDHRPYLGKCGELKREPAEKDQILTITSPTAVRTAMMVQDPLCATCRALHQRLVQEGIYDKFTWQVVLFPLDSECNWMLDRPLHPGACTVAKAVLCSKDQVRQMLDWAYQEQDYLTRAGKTNDATLRAVIQQRWGGDILGCMDSKETKVRLNRHLHFASDNNIPVSTPQLMLGKQRVCDEDTDLGLKFTLKQLAPEVLK